MINKRFEEYKLRRELKRSGKWYTFKRQPKNKFGEPIGGADVDVATLNGLYHEQNSFVQMSATDTTRIRTKKSPMILCLYEDAAGLSIGDQTTINGKTFKVAGVVDVQEWHIVADVSLEVVDDGVRA